ncbi:MAG: hypothetical protein K8R90_02325 [Candidatus Cloacimonetes bacterium]|nr:hypothetical protein [Candidatus Cloacimonadota bacterium]
MKPPYTQETLARAIVASLAANHKGQFYAAHFSPDELEQQYADVLAEAGDEKAMGKAMNQARREWVDQRNKAMRSWEDIRDHLTEEERETLACDSLAVGSRDVDYITCYKRYNQFVVYMHSHRASYTLTIDQMIETADGWKCTGDMKLIKCVPESRDTLHAIEGA